MAQAKKKIGFELPVDERMKAPRKMGPEPPMLSVLRIAVSPFQLNAIKDKKFVRLGLRSKDGKFAVDLVCKDVDSFLELVPSRMPTIQVDMDAESFWRNVESKTIVMLLDGLGHSKGFAVAAVQQVELLDSRWFGKKKKMVN